MTDYRADLRGSASLLDAILTGVHEAIIVVEERDRIILVNKHAEDLFEYRSHEVQGKPLDLLLSLHSLQERKDNGEQAATPPLSQLSQRDKINATGHRKNGTELSIGITAHPCTVAGEASYALVVRALSETEPTGESEKDDRDRTQSVDWMDGQLAARQQEKLIENILKGTSSAVGEDFLRSLIHQLVLILDVRSGFIARVSDQAGKKSRTLVLWDRGGFQENFEYDLEGTPCEKVLKGELAFYPQGVTQRFPRDKWLIEQGLESYLGVPFFASSGEAIGHLGLLDDKPMSAGARLKSILKLFALRVGVELERKRMMDTLRESEERFRKVFEEAPIGIAILDAEKKFVKVNKSFQEILGYSHEEFSEMTLLDVTHPDDLEETIVLADQMFRAEIPGFRREKRCISKQQENVWVDLTATVLKNQNGKPLYGLGMVSKITDRKRTEDALRSSEERVRSILDTAHDAFVSIDAQGRITEWNAQAERTFGWSRQEALDRRLADTIIPLQYREAHEKGLQHFWATGEGPLLNKRIELRALHRNGHEFPIELAVWPIEIDGEQTFNSFVRDITRRKQVEEKLEQAKEMADAANKTKSDFLASMSHEIRTPMNGVLGMAQLALSTDLTAEQREYTELIQASGETLLTLLNDILDLSKIESAKLELEAIPFSLRETLRNTLNIFMPQAEARGLELISHIPEELPDSVIGDPARLRQCLTNLVSNALKFTEQGSVSVSVARVPDTEESACFHFVVQDTGAGIPAEKQSVIFEAFEQANRSTTREYGGTGLGLAITSRLVEMMEGRIWVESEVGNGSAFHFTVQLGLHEEEWKSSAPVDIVELRNAPVLVVADNRKGREWLVEMCRGWRMNPCPAEDERAALAALRDARSAGTPFGLVLIDVQTPETNNFSRVRAIIEDPNLARSPVILLSPFGLRGDAARCRELGVAAYLTKPIAPSELLDAIQNVFAQGTSDESHQIVTRYSIRESRQRAHVLLAEDNPVNRRVVAGFLKKRGHTVTLAEDGRQALELFKQEDLDIILMDIEMPVMDGFTAVARIRNEEGSTKTHIPIVALTAHAIKGDRERCLDAGMDGYLAKPIQASELFRTIERLILSPQKETEQESKSSPHQIFDREFALKTLDGDAKLLAQIAQEFLTESPKLLATIREKLTEQDADGVERAAHNLKGSLGYFGAEAAMKAAKQLEAIAGSGEFSQAEAAFSVLEREMKRLEPEVAALTNGANAP